jgi:predicted NBD/HSP70 family sugar kinase
VTGHIPGATVLRRLPFESVVASPGSNHVALRATNERLVLSLIRAHGELSKAQIAELSGLTAQTASVISKSLVEAGLLIAGSPVRGRVGQPFVPLRLNPQGAMFFGLHVGRREACLALVDFTGHVIKEASVALDPVHLPEVLGFARGAVAGIRGEFNFEQNARIQGLGASIAARTLGLRTGPSSWQEIDDAFAALGQEIGISTYVSNDAVAACSAEQIYGLGGGLSDFAYVFIDDSVSGGLVQDGRIHFSRDGAGANLGKVFVPNADGEMVSLRSLASAGMRKLSAKELELLARGVAYAVYSASAVVSYSAVIVDGAIPTADISRVCALLRNFLADIDKDSATPLVVREGSHARKAAALGAACLPLADRFYPEAPSNRSNSN